MTFDREEARKILAAAPPAKDAVDFIVGPAEATAEIRKRWPRGFFTADKPCSGCGFVGIAYASTEHYIAGDW